MELFRSVSHKSDTAWQGRIPPVRFGSGFGRGHIAVEMLPMRSLASLPWTSWQRFADAIRPYLAKAARLMEPAHGTTEQHGSQQSVYCARCHRWQVVEVDPELALQIHEVTVHRP